MAKKPQWMFVQSAVIPYCVNEDGLSVVLITSRRSGKWGIPKGVVEKDMSPHESAAKEAFEEAGVLGEVRGTSVGLYKHEKWGGTCTVEVFPMKVTTLLDGWPEKQESDPTPGNPKKQGRHRRVVPMQDALELVVDPGLRSVMEHWSVEVERST